MLGEVTKAYLHDPDHDHASDHVTIPQSTSNVMILHRRGPANEEASVDTVCGGLSMVQYLCRAVRLSTENTLLRMMPHGNGNTSAAAYAATTQYYVNVQYNTPGWHTPVARRRAAYQAAPEMPVPSVGALL